MPFNRCSSALDSGLEREREVLLLLKFVGRYNTRFLMTRYSHGGIKPVNIYIIAAFLVASKWTNGIN